MIMMGLGKKSSVAKRDAIMRISLLNWEVKLTLPSYMFTCDLFNVHVYYVQMISVCMGT